MATDSTKTENDSKNEKAEKADAAPEEREREEAREETGDKKKNAAGTATGSGKKSEADSSTMMLSKSDSESSAGDADAADDAADDAAEAAAEAELAALRSSGSRGWGAGAAAVVSAGLGLVSLTGTSFSEMLRERKQLLGQIESGQGGSAADQVNALYGAPWHASAMINGIFALLAVVVGGLLMAMIGSRADTRPWIKAVGLGGLVLGVIGLIVAGGMYFDIFAAQPEIPATGGGGAPGQ